MSGRYLISGKNRDKFGESQKLVSLEVSVLAIDVVVDEGFKNSVLSKKTVSCWRTNDVQIWQTLPNIIDLLLFITILF